MRLDTKTRYLQIAFNYDLGMVKRILPTLPSSERIIIEAGTPFIKQEGARGIRTIANLWHGLVVADLKVADGALGEVEMARRAGASAATVLGNSPTETLNIFVDACHRRGMHFIWHNCGYIVDLFPDMIELGVDVVQLDQPRLMGHQTLIEALGGKVCMWNTVDIQWATSEGVSDEDIRQEVADMVRAYDMAGHGGGYIAKHYPQPWDIELPPERQRLIYEAFMENGCRALPA